MVARGAPLNFVAAVLGHSTLSCSARYGRHAPEDAARHAIRLLEATGTVAAPSGAAGPNEAPAPLAASPAALPARVGSRA